MIESFKKFESGPRHYPLAAAFAALSLFVLGKGYFLTRVVQRRHLKFDADGITDDCPLLPAS